MIKIKDMVRTRKKKEETDDASPIINADSPLAVRKLTVGSRGGRHTSGITRHKDEEVEYSKSWCFHS